jgi:hypothetical protein
MNLEHNEHREARFNAFVEDSRAPSVTRTGRDRCTALA